MTSNTPEASASGGAIATPVGEANGKLGRSDWKVIILASLGGALEFYDFVIFSTFAVYIGQQFFPSDNKVTELLNTFVVFAVGYLARPIGGIILSNIGDRLGRRKVFIGSMLAMSISTVAIGLLPGYAQWGVTASVLLVLLRITQGFCLGGELPGAITYVVETAPRNAGFATGVIFFCVNSGVGLASVLSLVLHHTLSTEDLRLWGWRIAFLIGGALGLVSFKLRLALTETPEFSRIKSRGAAAKAPFGEMIRTHGAQVWVGIAALALTSGFNGVIFSLPAFLPNAMGYSPSEAIACQSILLGAMSFGLLGAAWLGDRIPRRWLLRAAGLAFALLSYAWYAAAASHSVNLLLLGVIAGLAGSVSGGTWCGLVADIFPTRIRFSGVALVLNIAFALFSGIAPLVATWLVASTGQAANAGWFVAACGAICFLSTLVLHRYDGRIRAGTLASAERPNPQI